MTKLVKLGFGHLKMENKPCIASVLSKRFHSFWRRSALTGRNDNRRWNQLAQECIRRTKC